MKDQIYTRKEAIKFNREEQINILNFRKVVFAYKDKENVLVNKILFSNPKKIVVEELKIEKKVVEEPKIEKKVVEEPKIEKTKIEEPKIEKKVVEELIDEKSLPVLCHKCGTVMNFIEDSIENSKRYRCPECNAKKTIFYEQKWVYTILAQ